MTLSHCRGNCRDGPGVTTFTYAESTQDCSGVAMASLFSRVLSAQEREGADAGSWGQSASYVPGCNVPRGGSWQDGA